MPARLHYMILCDAVGSAQGKPTYYGVFDRIQALQFPAQHQMLAIAIQLSCDPGTHQLSLKVVDSSGKDQIQPLPPRPIESKDPFGLTTTSITLFGLTFQKPGIYTFQLFVDDQLVGARDFFVEKLALQMPQQGTPPAAPPGDPGAKGPGSP